MSDFPNVHWHEGLFLQPHHLQLLQRDLSARIGATHLLTRPFAYGLLEFQLSTGALENKRLQVTALRAVMPSGRMVLFPGNADMNDLDIKARFDASADEFYIFLGIPNHNPEDANTMPLNKKDDGTFKRLYHVIEKEFRDENTGENKQVVQLRRLNARLMLSPENGMESIPLLRVSRRTLNNASVPAVDARFTPPSLVLDGWSSLREDLKSFSNELTAATDRARTDLVYGGFAVDQIQGGVKVEKWLRSMLLNRYGFTFAEMVRPEVTLAISPFQIYLTLRQLLGELDALRPAKLGDEPRPIDRYNHEDCGPLFAELLRQIRAHLQTEEKVRYWKVNLPQETRKEGNAFFGKLSDDQVTKPTEYFLAVKTAQDPFTFAHIMQDTNVTKLLAESKVFGAWPPVPLVWEKDPPMEFDKEANLHFYRLAKDKGQMVWKRICEEKSIAVRWVGIDSSKFEVALYMRIPPE